jgi:hypothetical protein
MVEPAAESIRVIPLSRPLAKDVRERLVASLEICPDLAFAHLTEVVVADREASRVLFVWLLPAALGSLRSALDLVAGAVARSLPGDEFVDVVILNSAPELLLQVEAASGLLVETDGEERQRALAAARAGGEPAPAEPASRPWWWPFG